LGKKEKIQKEIERLERYAKFYLSMLLAILTGIVWSIYAILEKKVNSDIIILSGVGLILSIFIAFKVKSIDYQQDELLDELEKEN
jgi:uncharacterized protein with PQ loop repeat